MCESSSQVNPPKPARPRPGPGKRRGLLFSVALSLWLAQFACNPRSNPGSEAIEEAPINVRAVYPVIRPMEEVIEVYGNLEPALKVEVVSEVSGQVIEILAEEGQQVKKGQLLARIDDEEYRLNFRQAESAWRVARSDYLSAKELFKEGLKSKSEMEKLRRAYEDARSNLELARLRLANTKITSPITGTVVKRNVELHQQLAAMESLFTIADLSSYKIPITVTEAEVAKLRKGQKVRIRIDALAGDEDDYPLEGRVAKVGSEIDPASGTVAVEVEVPDPGQGARPGMFARVRIITDVHPQALVIPRRALISEEGDNVWVVEGESVKLVQVKTGLTDEQGVEILSGLSPKDLVIVEGQAALTPKSKVLVVNREELERPAAAEQQ